MQRSGSMTIRRQSLNYNTTHSLINIRMDESTLVVVVMMIRINQVLVDM